MEGKGAAGGVCFWRGVNEERREGSCLQRAGSTRGRRKTCCQGKRKEVERTPALGCWRRQVWGSISKAM